MTENNDSEKMIVELDGQVYRFEEFDLTFGEMLVAKQKAHASKSKKNQDEMHKRHEAFWMVNELFKKNGMDVDIAWLKDVPMSDLYHVIQKMAEKNNMGME